MASGNDVLPPTAKLQTGSTDGGASTAAAHSVDPAMLEEDDEFEDFPVDGKRNALVDILIPLASVLTKHQLSANFLSIQIGPARKPRCLAIALTCGKRAGMTMTPVRSFRNS